MKIKILNVILIISAILFSFYFIITRDDKLGLILKDGSILFTITLPYWVQILFKIKINDKIKFFYILFVFIAQFLGATVELYNKVYCFDKFTHFLSGIVSSFAALFLLVILKKYDKKDILFNILFIISFTLMVASLWEFFEYFSDIIFKNDAQRVLLTGVDDTMKDMIVANLGSLIVAVCYWWEESLNKPLFIKKYISELTN